MSNKLVEHKESKEILTGNQKKILFWICFIILSIVFITVLINILLTSKAFNTQMEEMVLGEDYYMEDIVITGKRAEDASADTISQNYFFYYNNGKVNDYHKRMQVPEFVYSEYDVGDSIAAYTTDHVSPQFPAAIPFVYRSEIPVRLYTFENPFQPNFCFGNHFRIVQDIGQITVPLQPIGHLFPTVLSASSQPSIIVFFQPGTDFSQMSGQPVSLQFQVFSQPSFGLNTPYR